MFAARLIPLISVLLPCVAVAETKPISVKIGLMEPLALLDSSSSERYRQSLEGALFYAIGENGAKLEKCGYKFETELTYFDNNDKIAPKEDAARLEAARVWLIVGPRRSDQFVAASRGLTETAMISPMAGADSVTSMKPPFFTMYPSTDELARVAIQAVTKEGYGSSYGAVVDATCSACRDFESRFSKAGEGKFNRAFLIDVAGESPDLAPLLSALKEKPVQFLLVPNYSKLTGHTIAAVQERYPSLKFVGGDGWGDGQYGFLEAYGIRPSVQGLTVRGGKAPDEMNRFFKVYSLDRNWKGETLRPPYTAYAVIELVRRLTSDLCTWRPKTREDFLKRLTQLKQDAYQSKVGIGIFKLADGKLRYAYTLPGKGRK